MNNKQLRSLASVLPGVALVTLILTISMFISVQAKGTDANLTINKTADPLAYSGSTVTFTIAVTNTSGTMLTSVVTSDPLAPLCDRVIGELGSTSYSYNCSLSGKTADFSNSVTVTGILLGVGVVSDTDTVFVSVINPDINIDKTADPTTILAEETVVYTYTVTNPGDDALTAVLVTDDKCSPVSGPAIISGNGNSTLDPGEIWAYTCSTALTVDTTNTATVTGTDSLDGTVDDSDTAFVNVIAPAIEIAKTPDVQIVNSGEDVDFTLTVSNTGDVELSGVTVTDEQCDTLTGPSGDDGDGVLQTTENWTYSCAVNNVTDGFINSATVTGTHPLAGIVTDADAAKVLLADTLTCPTDMFAYWRLDEPSGGTTFDDSYNGHDAVCATGRCPSTVPGIINNAQAFDGSDEVNVPYVPGDDSLNWGVNDSFSIEFWIKRPGTPTGNEVVVGRQGPTHPRPHIWVGPAKTSGNAVFCLYDTSGTGSCIKGNSAVTGGDWHHVVAVRDANLGQNRIYVDGVLEGSVVKTYSAGFDTTTPLNIGWLNLDPYYHFSGALDEVALYDRALSPTEIQQHYYQVLSVGRHYCEASPFAPVIFSTPVTEATVQRPYTTMWMPSAIRCRRTH